MADFDPHQYGSPDQAFDPHAIGAIPESSAVGILLKDAQSKMAQEQPRTPQMQEQYSNPTQWPGFDKLSSKEQLERIKFSMYDPANTSNLGTFVPPGMYEHPATRAASEFLSNVLLPEKIVSNPLMQFGRGAVNTLGRIGMGTGLNAGMAQNNPENKNSFMGNLKSMGTVNAILEAGLAPFRSMQKVAEIYNPLARTEKHMNEMRNNYNAVHALEQSHYAMPMQKYGNTPVTGNSTGYSSLISHPEDYLSFTDQQKRYFTPNIKKSYNDFLGNPTFSNLHTLQSQMGKDWATLAGNPNKIKTSQNLYDARESVKEKIQDFLSKDKEALAEYNKGMEVAKNQRFPYESNPTLKKVIQGKTEGITPKKLHKSIETAKAKNINPTPADHHLQEVYKDMSNALSNAELTKAFLPHYLRKFSPDFAGITQNALVKKLAGGLNPLYYGVGRTAGTEMNALNNQEGE